MNNELCKKISKARYELSKDVSSVIFGELNDGVVCDENLRIKPYCDFLNVCNGASCGDIDLWSNEDIGQNQFRVTDLDGGSEKWVCIGQILYEPLVINLDSEEVYLFYQGHEKEIEGKCFGKFDDFLMEYVFGEKYAEIIPDVQDDEWYSFLRRINFV